MTGADLKRARENAGLSRARMARALGYTSPRHTLFRLMAKYEHTFEHQELPQPVLERIARWQNSATTAAGRS